MKTVVALLSALCLAATATSASAEQPFSGGGPGDRLCGSDQLSGQYECVTSVPLSEEDVRVSLAYLAGGARHEAELAPVDVAGADAAAKDRAP